MKFSGRFLSADRGKNAHVHKSLIGSDSGAGLTRTRGTSPAPQVPLRVSADPLDALLGPVRGSGNRHRHPTHRGSSHHAAAAASRAPNTGSAASRSRHLDAEVREDPDHGLRSVSNAQPPGSSPPGGSLGALGALGSSAGVWGLKFEMSFLFFRLFSLVLNEQDSDRDDQQLMEMSGMSLQPSQFTPPTDPDHGPGVSGAAELR